MIGTTLYIVPTTSIASAIAELPATGGTVFLSDGVYSTSGFTLGVSVCPAVLGGYTLTGGSNVTINTTGQITMLCTGQIIGGARDGFVIQAVGSFPISTAVIQVGDNSHLNNSVRLMNFTINNPNLIAGLTAIQAQGTNEGTEFSNLLLENYLSRCINVDGATVNTANMVFSDIHCTGWTGATDSIRLSNVKNSNLFRITATSNSGVQLNAAGIHVTGSFQNQVLVDGLHCEKHDDCLLTDNPASIVGIHINAENGTLRTLHIAAGSNGSSQFIGLRNNGNGAGFPVVLNDITGTNLSSANPPSPGGIISRYFWTTGGTEEYCDVISCKSSLYGTRTNCSSSAAPAVCGSAAAGSVVIAAGATTVTVNTTAVTANSQIDVIEDDSLGTKLGVTCNTTSLGATKISARVAGTSFTITTAAAPVTNPSCLSYHIVN